MAGRLFLPMNPAVNANGAPYSAAKIYVRTNLTDTPVTVYSDYGLSTAHENPIVANSAGFFPPIFTADENAFFRIKLTTSADVQVFQQDYCPALSGPLSQILLDLTTNGRFRVYGSGGDVYIAAGDPTGDDSGGTLRITGWNATALDVLTLNALGTVLTGGLTVESQITTEGGKYLSGLRIDADTFSGATLDIPLPSDTEVYDLYLLDFLISDDLADLRARGDFGSGVVSSAGAYTYQTSLLQAASLTHAASTATYIPLTGAMDSSQVKTWMHFEISTRALNMRGNNRYIGDVGGGAISARADCGGYCNASTGEASSIRLLMSAGTMSGTWVLYARKNANVGVTS